MEGCPTAPNDETSAAPSQRTREAVDVVSSVPSCANSRNARCRAHCSGRSSGGRYCCRVLQRRANRLFGSAGGQAALGAPGRPSTWAGARVCARGRTGVCCLSWCGGGVSNAGAERSPKMSTAARGLTGMRYRNRNITCRNITCRNILSREVIMCTH